LMSTELDEVRQLSDRMLIIYEGEIVGQVTQQTSVEEIGLMMAGSLKQPSSSRKEVTIEF
jgi:general nucleoside transport system ATP-binding protein